MFCSPTLILTHDDRLLYLYNYSYNYSLKIADYRQKVYKKIVNVKPLRHGAARHAASPDGGGKRVCGQQTWLPSLGELAAVRLTEGFLCRYR